MEGIQHRFVEVNGIRMHVAEKGEGPVVLLIHGFPELWYTWRHQIVSLAARGFKAVAPDLRGYGDTDAPKAIESYTCFHLVGDLIALIDSLSVNQVFVVGHDWGALLAWYLCMFRPDRVKALVNLSVPYPRRNPSVRTVEGFRTRFGDDYYMCRFQEPGEVEAEISQIPVSAFMKNVLTSRRPGPPIVPKGGFGFAIDTQLPSWLSEDDINYYASKFEQNGFTGPLNYYRNLNRNWELTAPWTGAPVKVPTKFIVGDEDVTYTTPGMKEYLHSDWFKNDVPFLQEMVVLEGVAHFLNQERADEISNHIYEFIKKF
ncbi:hypothetical protein ACHQM5_026680 [Ranunculus cassubicifolius]